MSILVLNRNANYSFDEWLCSLEKDLYYLTTKEKELRLSKDNVEGFYNYEKTGELEIRALELNLSHQFEKIIATSEFDILRAARIREYLGIDGQKVTSALAYRDKYIMKEYVSAKGLKTPNYRMVDSPTDIYSFIQKQGLPIVIKPREGSGSEGVELIRDISELKKFVSENQVSKQLVEEYVEGEMYHIDGLVINSNIVFQWPSKYINGCLSHKNAMFNGSYQLNPNNPLFKRLTLFTEQVINSLPIVDDMAFHAEVFMNKDDELVFCEIACRKGGGYIGEAIEQSFQVDLTKLSVQAQCGIGVQIPHCENSTLSGFLLIPYRRGKIKSLKVNFAYDWITKLKVNAEPGEVYDINSASSVDVLAQFLIEGQNEEQLIERIHILATEFDRETKWEMTF